MRDVNINNNSDARCRCSGAYRAGGCDVSGVVGWTIEPVETSGGCVGGSVGGGGVVVAACNLNINK